MTPELLFVTLMLLDLAFVLFAFKLGRSFLYMTVIANIMFTNMVSSKIVTIFGLDSTVANVFYAAIFLATDLLSEHFGKKHAVRAVWLGFAALTPIIVFAPIVNLFDATPYTTEVGDALSTIFGKTARIAVASIIAYLASNLFDVWWYHQIKQKLPDRKWLWLRNNGSTMLSQLVDNTTFVLLAFAGAVPTNVLWQIFLSGYIIKVLVAACDTPFVYISLKIKPLPEPGDAIGEATTEAT